MTPLAVFLAARLADGSAARQEAIRLKNRMKALSGIYWTGMRLILQSVDCVRVALVEDRFEPPAQHDFDLIIEALRGVAILELPDTHLVEDLVLASRAMATSKTMLTAFDRTALLEDGHDGLSGENFVRKLELQAEILRDALERVKVALR